MEAGTFHKQVSLYFPSLNSLEANMPDSSGSAGGPVFKDDQHARKVSFSEPGARKNKEE
jgi:hypothetical protein